MWRAISNTIYHDLQRNTLNCSVNVNGNFQIVRWRRKPRWYPVAKSKIFRVPERKPQILAEKLELQRLTNNYKTQMRSLRLFLREEYERIYTKSTSEHFTQPMSDEEAEFQRCLQINEEWNKEVALFSNEYHEKENTRALEEAERIIWENEELEENRLRQIEERVRKEKEQSQTLVVPENIDEIINHALANPVNYNFSVDLNGNMYKANSKLNNSDAKLNILPFAVDAQKETELPLKSS